MNIFLKLLFLFLLFTQTLLSNTNLLTKEEKEWIKQNPTVTIGVFPFSPYQIVDNNKVTGYQVELMDAIVKYVGLKPTYTTGVWSEIYLKFKANKIDVVLDMLKNPEREKVMLFPDRQVEISQAIFAQKYRDDILGFESLDGKIIASYAKHGFRTKLIELFPNSKIIDGKDKDDMFRLVSEGKADACIIDVKAGLYTLQNNLKTHLEIKSILNIPGVTPAPAYEFAVRNTKPILYEILNKADKALPLDIKQKIWNKWFGEKRKNINFTEEEKRYLKTNSTLKVQGLATFPPFNFSQNGIPSGYSIDYMKLLGKYLNVDIEFTKAKSFGETITMFKKGEIDILPHIARNQKREEYIDYTNFNHIEYSIGATIRKDEDISDMKDLENQTIAVVNKSFIHSFLKKNYPEQKLLLLPSTSAAVEAVSLGDADALIGSIPTMDFYIQKNWLSNVATTKINNVGLPNRVLMPMGVQEGNRVLKSILEKANLAIAHNEIVQLKQKWLNLDIENETTLLLTEEEKSYLLKKEKIKMCVLPNWLPFEQIDKEGKHKGVGADIIEIISKKLKTPFELVQTREWSQSLQNIKDRKCDILPVAMDVPSRRDAMDFTKPYTKEPFVIATRENTLFIKDSKDIGDKKIGIVKSYAFIEVLKRKNPGIKIINVKNAKDGLEKVRSGELFGYIDIVPAIMYSMQQNSLVDLKISGKLEFDIKLSMASRNDEPLLNSILQKSLNTIDEDEIRTIVGRWLSVKVEHGADYTLLWQISLVFLLVILVVLYKNREVGILNKKLSHANEEIQDQQLMVNKHVMILTTDLAGKITFVNEAYCNKIGYSFDELVGSAHNIIRHPDMPKEFFKDLWETITLNKNWTGEIKNLTKDKKIVYFSVVIEPHIKAGKKVGYRAIADDITDKKRIEELSITDKLTGLYNRLKIDELLLKQVDLFKRYKTTFSVILLDIDSFKLVNDNFGHDVGDEVLKVVANSLKVNIRKTDETGRWGGEEFIVICTNTSSENAFVVAENIRKSIENIVFDKAGRVTISLGVTSFLEEDNISTLFKRVDSALYKAKNSGKNRTIAL